MQPWLQMIFIIVMMRVSGYDAKKMKCIVSQNEKKGIWVNPRRKAELFELCEMNAKKIIKTGVGIGSAFPNDLERGAQWEELL